MEDVEPTAEPDPAPVARSIAELADGVVAELVPEERGALPLVSSAFFSTGTVRAKIAAAILGGRRGGVRAFAGTSQLIVQTVILVLNGVATEALPVSTQRIGGVRGWRNRRALRKALAADVPALRSAARIAPLAAVRAHGVGELTREIALHAGIPPEQAERTGTVLAVALTGRP